MPVKSTRKSAIHELANQGQSGLAAGTTRERVRQDSQLEEFSPHVIN